MGAPQRISTCLWYNQNGEEAANFYVSLFPNSRVVHVSRYGPGHLLPEGTALVTRFELDGVAFAALNGGPIFSLSEAASIVVMCDGQAEIDRLWDALIANGGAEGMCGWLKDRFGLFWQILPAQTAEWMASDDKDAAARMFGALMSMQKLELAALEAAFLGKAA